MYGIYYSCIESPLLVWNNLYLYGISSRVKWLTPGLRLLVLPGEGDWLRVGSPGLCWRNHSGSIATRKLPGREKGGNMSIRI